eukprot:CAMPEP_0184492756 /NCGR_PEP_ID=MMETSP0113_2-20130426/24178_1 /TAXON_ID=91329 /ORGANISM="Norrisiella sphaerica, Strain BC52" /LENGTH=98 /DNA_ID=CAMNT_0026877729 /DNA_START=1 /DNA_END=294 /DNA_ORIENTATION=+
MALHLWIIATGILSVMGDLTSFRGPALQAFKRRIRRGCTLPILAPRSPHAATYARTEGYYRVRKLRLLRGGAVGETKRVREEDDSGGRGLVFVDFDMT